MRVPVDDETRQRHLLPGRGGAVRWVTSQAARATGSASALLPRGRGQVQQPHEPLDDAIGGAQHEEARGLQGQPVRGDPRRPCAFPLLDQGEDLRAVVTGRLRIGLAPGVPVHRRQDAGKVAEQELLVEGGPLLRPPGRRVHVLVDVVTDRPEGPLVAVEVAPPQVGVQRVTGQVVREESVRTLLDEGEVAQPLEQLVRIVQGKGVPQEGLGRRAGERADLKRAAVHTLGTVSTNWCRSVATRSG